MSIIVVTHWRVLKEITGEEFDIAEIKKYGNLWLIRHTETALNAANALRGHIEIPLTVIGQQQCGTLLKSLEGKEGLDVCVVYSSDLSRASVLAKLIADFYNVPLFITRSLRPADLGDLTGKVITEEIAKQLDEIDAKGDDGVFPNGETCRDFRIRINKVFKYLLGATNAKNI